MWLKKQNPEVLELRFILIAYTNILRQCFY